MNTTRLLTDCVRMEYREFNSRNNTVDYEADIPDDSVTDLAEKLLGCFIRPEKVEGVEVTTHRNWMDFVIEVHLDNTMSGYNPRINKKIREQISIEWIQVFPNSGTYHVTFRYSFKPKERRKDLA